MKEQIYLWQKDSSFGEEPSSLEGDPAKVLHRLNPRQREGVTFPDLPLLLVGGPGTGKSYTLACRLAYRILTGEIEGRECLVLTFSRQGVNQFRKYLSEFLPSSFIFSLPIFTFWEFGWYLFLEEVPYFEPGSLLCSLEMKALAEEENQVFRQTSRWFDQVVQYKRKLLFPEDLPEGEEGRRIYEELQRLSEKYQIFDTEDLLLWSVRLLEEHPEVRERYCQRFRTIFVDEYHDICFSQYRLLRLLAFTERPDLTVAGDPDQVVLQPWGSDVRYFLLFDQDYPHAKTIYLTQTYRFPQSRLEVLESLLEDRKWLKKSSSFLYWTEVKEEEKEKFLLEMVNGFLGHKRKGWPFPRVSPSQLALLTLEEEKAEWLQEVLEESRLRLCFSCQSFFASWEEKKRLALVRLAIFPGPPWPLYFLRCLFPSLSPSQWEALSSQPLEKWGNDLRGEEKELWKSLVKLRKDHPSIEGFRETLKPLGRFPSLWLEEMSRFVSVEEFFHFYSTGTFLDLLDSSGVVVGTIPLVKGMEFDVVVLFLGGSFLEEETKVHWVYTALSKARKMGVLCLEEKEVFCQNWLKGVTKLPSLKEEAEEKGQLGLF